MSVAEKVGVYMNVEQHLKGNAECIHGKLYCRGKRDYSFSRFESGIITFYNSLLLFIEKFFRCFRSVCVADPCRWRVL